ncbi:hypothetical protein [Deinococcus rubellus]|uniref:hypothetical protein n=1 Tax=Deinococcus rubellus TaxID=1889240 RepID=UPI0031EF4714
MTDTTSGSIPRHADQNVTGPSYVIGLDFGTESARAILTGAVSSRADWLDGGSPSRLRSSGR